jgi:hypothetical protein
MCAILENSFWNSHFTTRWTITLHSIAKMNPEHSYDCWLQDRCRWDHLHQTMDALLIMAFILLLTGLFAGATSTAI